MGDGRRDSTVIGIFPGLMVLGRFRHIPGLQDPGLRRDDVKKENPTQKMTTFFKTRHYPPNRPALPGFPPHSLTR